MPKHFDSAQHKAPLGPFLRRNPFSGPFTDGLFFRDKMRAIHRVAPDIQVDHLLEVGGGQSGLSKLLYPNAMVTNLDIDSSLAASAANLKGGVRFVTGNATGLPFASNSFDLVTMFDLLEHVVDDRAVVSEAIRVTKPEGFIMVSTPDASRWKYPFYAPFRPICPPESELFEDWGHVRRGYDIEGLVSLFSTKPEVVSSFINPLLALSHDISFSRLPTLIRALAHLAVSPVSLTGYFLDQKHDTGMEIVALWKVNKIPTENTVSDG